MAGGGVIIIRRAMQSALTEPLVGGSLPTHIQAQIDPFINDDVGSWSDSDHDKARHAFNWAAHHC